VTQTVVVYFALVLVIMGALAAGVAAEIRTHVEAALSEAETRHQLQEVEHELQIARSIQQSLLPKSRPQIAGFQIAGWSRTADDTGGDFYDWKRLPDGRWIVVLADVTGHGIGPAILASVCRAYSRASFNVRDRLETMLKNINESFAEDLTPERFATFVPRCATIAATRWNFSPLVTDRFSYTLQTSSRSVFRTPRGFHWEFSLICGTLYQSSFA
jgi:hypothetical protein